MGEERDAHQAGPVYIDVEWFKRAETDLEDASNAYNDACKLLTDIAKAIETRRQADAAVKCDFCDTKFRDNIPYAQADFQVQTPAGEMVWRRIVSCRNANCLVKYNNTIEDIRNPGRVSA